MGALALAAAFGLMAAAGAEAQQTQSRLYEVTKSKKLRVCQFPLYYSISFRNPKTGEIEGIDADLAKELAKELDAKLEIVETSFGSFIADLQAGKCEIGMFGVGATLKRAQAVEFSKPYLITNIYVVTRKDSKIKKWEDLDQKGVKAAVVARQLHRALHEGLPQERRGDLDRAAQHARGRAGGAAGSTSSSPTSRRRSKSPTSSTGRPTSCRTRSSR